jgi:NAD(P)-dependent dehydrogenase (short-subunit alcohol dehydrogenase family)
VESLSGKVVLVTGASRGIGADTAAALAREGARVVCAARTLREQEGNLLPGSLERTVESIRRAGGEAAAIETNLAVADGCVDLVERTIAAYGPVDVLVNNAAVGFFGPVLDLRPSRWDLSWRITVSAPVLLSQLVLPEMLRRGAGRIINVSSESAVGPGPGPHPAGQQPVGDVAYGAQKAALERFTQGLAEEVQDAGVGVAAIAPSQLVPTPGAVFNRLVSGPEDPRAEPPSYMPEAICLLATVPLEQMTGRVVYSQQVLLEHGRIASGAGLGVDPDRRVSGFASSG